MGGADGSERKRVDMLHELLDGGWLFSEFWVKALDEGTVVQVKEALSHDAETEHPYAVPGEVAAGQLDDNFLQLLGPGSNGLLNETIQGIGRLNHFAGHEQTVPFRAIGMKQAAEEAVDIGAQAVFRRAVAQLDRAPHGLGGAMAFIEDGAVELGFVAEMVIDGGDIDPGTVGDFADGGLVKATFGKNGASGKDELTAGVLDGSRIGDSQHEFKMLV